MIKLSPDAGWRLHGAADIDQLNKILNDLHDHCDGYDATAERLGIDRATIANVARWYQSLWMHA